MDIDFSNITASLSKKRKIERMDLLAINQDFLAIGETKHPMQRVVSVLLSRFVSPRILPVLENIARHQDTSQRLTYYNSSQASKEMVSMLLLACMVQESPLSPAEERSLREQIDYGILALSLRYYKADKVPLSTSKGRFAENYYMTYAMADGLLNGLDHREQTIVTDILLMTAQEHRQDATFCDEPLIYRNASDAVILPFIGISFELNLSDKIKMTAQNNRGIGESLNYAKRLKSNMTPFGNAKGTAIEKFIARMVGSSTAPRTRMGTA